MINIFKMDLFRLFKTRSFYVMLAIMAAITIFFTYMVKDTFDSMEAEDNHVQTESENDEQNSNDTSFSNGLQLVSYGEGEEPPAIIISSNPESVSVSDKNEITLLTMLYDSSCGMMLGLFICIFAVLFATADISHGFIKNIGGQVSSRSILILSKALSLLIYIILFFAAYLVVQAVSTQIFFGYIKLGDTDEFARYLTVQLLLHFALALFCMMAAILLKNNVISIIIAVLLCMDIPLLLCNIINNLLSKTGLTDFDISKYSLTRNIASLEVSMTDSDLIRAFAVGICFAAFSLAVNCMIFKKKDIV